MLCRMLFLALVCLAVGVSSEAPQSPWPTLTPTAQPQRQSFDNGQALAQLALTMEEEILVDMLPFKPPFKMDKKQMAVIIKLLKKAVKPVLKSERLRTMVYIVDDFIQDLEHNQENKKYYAGMLNAAQDVYGELNRMYNTEDEAQARTMSTVGNIYRQSVLNNWFVAPFRSYIIDPITTTVTGAVERISNMMPSNSYIVDTTWINNPFESLGENFFYYVDRISNWSARARSTLDATARLLDAQDESARCAGCGTSTDVSDNNGGDNNGLQ